MTHQPIHESNKFNGTQKVYRFANGRGASVIRHEFSYGSEQGLWELAVVVFTGDQWGDFDLDYTTEITDDVIGRLTWDQVEALLTKIEAMPGQMKEAA
jgi:hypothetical protein